MTVEDALKSGESITGSFTAMKPLDGCDITWGFTTMESLPFFISQLKRNEDGTHMMRNSIAFTEGEFRHFIGFMRLLLETKNE